MGQHIRVTLTPEQKEDIKARIKATSDRSVADRLRVVLYKADGYTNQEIAYLLQLESINTVTNWLRIYNQQGLDVLCTFKYKGSEPHLDEKQRLQLTFELKTHIYHTAKKVIAWVKEQFDDPGNYFLSCMVDMSFEFKGQLKALFLIQTWFRAFIFEGA